MLRRWLPNCICLPELGGARVGRVAVTMALLVFGAGPLAAAADDDALWLHYAGGEGPGAGKHIVFVSGDDEYRSEEACPMLAKLLAERHGFECTVLFAIDPADGTIKPDHQTNIPGMEALDDADLMVVFLRFRNLPAEQMKHFVDYVNSGKPVIGLRTATHAFNISSGPYKKYTWNSRDWQGGFGQQVLGDTWINHHGHHGVESTRGVANPAHAEHPVLRGVTDVWGPTDVYGVRNLKPSATVLMHGQVLAGMDPDDAPVEGPKNDPMMPLVWTQEVTGETGNTTRVVCTTMGASQDFESAGLRRLFVNACYWLTGLEDHLKPDANVEFVGDYRPTRFGFGTYQKGLKPADYR